MRPPTFQLEANPNAEVMRPEDKAKAKEALMSGALATSGAYETTPKFRFKDAGLQSVYEEVRGKFGLSDDALVETNTKPVAGDAPGKDPDDIPGWVQQLTKKLTDAYPNAPGLDPYKHNVTPAANAAGRIWDEDCTMAQKVIEAFYHGWYQQKRKGEKGSKESPAEVTGNVAELFGDVGSSKQNKRAQAIGETPQAIYGWCGPASAFALAISLMRKGYRFKTTKGPVMPGKVVEPKIEVPKEVEKEPFPGYNKNRERILKMVEDNKIKAEQKKVFEVANAIRLEIANQGAHFLANWSTAGYGKEKKNKGQVVDKELAKRQVGGKDAYTTELRQGDYISMIMKNSPLSGHVATVIREEKLAPKDATLGYQPGEAMSKIYMVSGNSKYSSVRVEVVTREMPYEGYDWDKFAKAGNGLTNKKQAVKNAEAEASGGKGGEKNRLFSLLVAKIRGNKTLEGKVKKMYPQGYMTGAGIQGNWYKPEVRSLMVEAGFSQADLDAYDASVSPDKIKKIEAAQDEVNAYKDKWAKDEQIAVERNEKIDPKYGKQKQATPEMEGHAWIVNVVRSSDLDANRIQDEVETATSPDKLGDQDKATVEAELLAKYGLERMPAGYDALFQQGMDYWEPRGGFKK